MFFVLILYTLVLVASEDYTETKPYIVVPLPLDFPNRNDRADQCWLRIEDIEIVETVTVVCHIAQSFLHDYIKEYNTRKIIEDKTDVTPWEEPYRDKNPLSKGSKNQNGMTSYQLVTVLDPTTDLRLYVTKHADCKLIMYSREGMTSYKVECSKILYFINTSSGVSSLSYARVLYSFTIVLFLYKYYNYVV